MRSHSSSQLHLQSEPHRNLSTTMEGVFKITDQHRNERKEQLLQDRTRILPLLPQRPRPSWLKTFLRVSNEGLEETVQTGKSVIQAQELIP